MKILGLDISFSNQPSPPVEIVKDQTPEIKVSLPDTKKPALIPPMSDPTLNYSNQRYLGRGSFQPSEYDMAEIGKIEDTDSYVRQAFTKKTALMFKEGWDFVGPNPRTIKYIKARFAQITAASKIPTNELFRAIGSMIIKKSNCFLIKVRDTMASGGKQRTTPARGNVQMPLLDPVAAYFPVPPETMEYRLNGGIIEVWRQLMPNGAIREYDPEDVIHIVYDKKDGFFFGTPTIIPVIDDIRALRKIEENIELLVYQHLFPLFQYKVGTKEMPATITEAGEREIDVIKREIQFMPTEGGIVTSERHEITAIGAEGRALRAEGYLTHFKTRVLAGLGVSAVDMGEGATANRACYSQDTETLTDSGWKYCWQITQENKIATYNPMSNQIEFHNPNGAMLLYNYTGKMIHFKNRNIDVLVTPDHDMWVGQPAQEHLNWQKIHADSISQHQVKFLSGGLDWQGIEPDSFELPHIPYDCYSIVPNPGPFPRIEVKDWLEFLGYYVSEGCLAKTKGKWAVTISQNARVNTKKVTKIRACLNRLPFKFNEYTDPGDQTTRFWINCKSLYLYLQENCGDYSYLKHLPSEILSFDKEYLKVVFEAAMLGDGTTDKRKGRSSRAYYSTSELLLDQMQEIALKLGYRAHIIPGSNCNRLVISKGKVSNLLKMQTSLLDYTGKVYCFNVPNHLFITRRNGRVGIHGNTADNMSRNLVDGVKDLQQVIEIGITEYLVKELLLESIFGDDILDEANTVTLKFREIDQETKIKKEKHYMELFKENILDHDETRRAIGMEPILLPTFEEAKEGLDDPDKYPSWQRMHWKLFEEPKLIIQSVDEQYTAQSVAAANSRSLSVTAGDIGSAAEQQAEKEMALEKEKNKGKVEVARATAAARKKDSFFSSIFNQIKEDTVERVHLKNKVDHNWVASLIRTQMNVATTKLLSSQLIAFKKGFARYASIDSQDFITSTIMARALFNSRITHYVSKLTEQVIASLKRNVNEEMELSEKARITRVVFDALEFRTNFIEDVEVRKAKNYGEAIALRDKYGVMTMFSSSSNDTSCTICSSRDGQELLLAFISLDEIPPYHASCNCSMMSPLQNSVRDSFHVRDYPMAVVPDDPVAGLLAPGETTKCPECGKTAIKKKDTPNTYNCRACRHSFLVDVEDGKLKGPKSKGSAFVRCMQKISSKVRERHPDWDEAVAVLVH